MEVALTPARVRPPHARALSERARPSSTATLRLTYAQFFDRCDRCSSALQRLGVKPGDRVAYIAPNTHAQLESFYAVPQIGAVLVPINYRLSADDFAYIITHTGATVVCAHADYLECLDDDPAAAAGRPPLRRARRARAPAGSTTRRSCARRRRRSRGRRSASAIC